MGCCLSSPIPPLSSAVKSPDPVKPDVSKPIKPVPELPVKPVIELQETVEEAEPIISEKVEKEEEIKHRRSHEEAASASASVAVVRTSSCTKEEVDAILIQCGKLSRSNSAAKTRRYSGSFDFDQNERIHGGGGGGGGDVEEEGRKTPQRNRGVERVNGSPRERRRRTPSRERERERGGSRRVSRSPAKRSEEASNPRGNLVISSNVKFVTVPARDKNNGDRRRITTVKRSIGEACLSSNAPPPPREQSQSPYRRRRKPLGGIDQNATKMIKRENESAKPQVMMMSRSRSLRKSRDFDFSPETLLLLQSTAQRDEDESSYTALLLKDIKNFHGGKKTSNDDDVEEDLLPSCVAKACSIVEAVADLNSTTSDLNQFRFTSSTTVKKADLMEPSFEKYVTVKRGGGGCSSLEEQDSSCASNTLT